MNEVGPSPLGFQPSAHQVFDSFLAPSFIGQAPALKPIVNYSTCEECRESISMQFVQIEQCVQFLQCVQFEQCVQFVQCV